MPTGIPVGSIAAYAAEPYTNGADHLDGSNWILCDGSTLSSLEYKDLSNMINPNASSPSFKIPDLRGRFIRGAGGDFSPGVTHSWMTSKDPDHPIIATFDCMAVKYHGTSKLSGKGAYSMIEYKSGSTEFKVSQGNYDQDKKEVPIETRPVNTYLHFIIKARKSDDDDLPMAALIPFAGPDNQSPPFPDFIRCDGSPAKQTDGNVSSLASIMGTTFDPRSPATDDLLYPPDLRGKFIRGVDPTLDPLRKVDPDNGKREPAPSMKESGVGTWQKFDTAFRKPVVDVAHFSKRTRGCPRSSGHENIHDSGTSDQVKWSGGAVETRPQNAAMDFYLNSVDPVSSDRTGRPRFPIGGIVAIPGPVAPDPNRWLLCDGRSLMTDDDTYKPLYSVIGRTWGVTANYKRVEFRVPDLRNYFIRGADTQGVPNGDPEYDKRFALQAGSTFGAGSYQKAAVALPQSRQLSLIGDEFKYPTGEISNPQFGTLGHVDIAAWDQNHRSFELDFTSDKETAPTFVAANFWICYA